MYTPDQVEAAAKLLRFDDPSSGDRTYAADILDAYAATRRAIVRAAAAHTQGA